MKILYIVPGIGLSTSELERRKRILNEFTSDGFNIDIRSTTVGPEAIESYCDEFLCVPDTLRVAIEAERNQYSAIILGCFGDPGIEALRESLTIPVIGPGEVSMHFASMLGRKFSIVTVLRNVVAPLEDLARKIGLIDRLASIRVINRSVLSIEDKSEEVGKELVKAGRIAIDDGADTLILGCMSEAFLGLSNKMQDELGVPVVDPVGTSVKFAEALITNKLTHSKLAYPYPPRRSKIEARQV